jgi:phospholipid transport system substrate-binding protein
MKKHSWLKVVLALVLGVVSYLPLTSLAADEAPDALIKRLSAEALDTISKDQAVQAGDVAHIMDLVDEKVMPHLDFQRMTSSAVGPAWRQASSEQRQRLQTEFKALLVRTYAGALGQAKDLKIEVRPLRASPEDREVIVRTVVKGRGDPVQLDYRLVKTPGLGAGWKIFNLNVMGVWLVDTYRTQFSQEINAKGIDGLIATLTQRNKANAANDNKAKG